MSNEGMFGKPHFNFSGVGGAASGAVHPRPMTVGQPSSRKSKWDVGGGRGGGTGAKSASGTNDTPVGRIRINKFVKAGTVDLNKEYGKVQSQGPARVGSDAYTDFSQKKVAEQYSAGARATWNKKGLGAAPPTRGGRGRGRGGAAGGNRVYNEFQQPQHPGNRPAPPSHVDMDRMKLIPTQGDDCAFGEPRRPQMARKRPMSDGVRMATVEIGPYAKKQHKESALQAQLENLGRQQAELRRSLDHLCAQPYANDRQRAQEQDRQVGQQRDMLGSIDRQMDMLANEMHRVHATDALRGSNQWDGPAAAPANAQYTEDSGVDNFMMPSTQPPQLNYDDYIQDDQYSVQPSAPALVHHAPQAKQIAGATDFTDFDSSADVDQFDFTPTSSTPAEPVATLQQLLYAPTTTAADDAVRPTTPDDPVMETTLPAEETNVPPAEESAADILSKLRALLQGSDALLGSTTALSALSSLVAQTAPIVDRQQDGPPNMAWNDGGQQHGHPYDSGGVMARMPMMMRPRMPMMMPGGRPPMNLPIGHPAWSRMGGPGMPPRQGMPPFMRPPLDLPIGHPAWSAGNRMRPPMHMMMRGPRF